LPNASAPANGPQNTDGEYCCPVMGKVFTEHTHIVAVKPTGNVYCFEAVEELNIKAKNWHDLITDAKFTRKDIIHLQDPRNVSEKVLDTFDHIRQGIPTGAGAQQDHNINLAGVSEDMRQTLAKIGAQTDIKPVSQEQRKESAKRALEEAEKGAASERKAAGGTNGTSGGSAGKTGASLPSGTTDPRLVAPKREVNLSWRPGAATWNTDAQAGRGEKGESRLQRLLREKRPQQMVESNETTGAMSKAFTSTAMSVHTSDQRTLRRKDRRVDKMGYVALHTNLGALNVELNCKTVPRTCENFLTLCGIGYYDGTIFHRSIKNFMIQGGDPTGTGTGGESIYGPKFNDEYDVTLKHQGRGILSMANSGPHTNGSQFFITYKSAPHLDGKHSVFGRVVGGLDVLAQMEKVPTDDEDRPLREIRLLSVEVFVDPFLEQEQEETKAKADAALAAENKKNDKRGAWFSCGRAADEVEASNSTVVGGAALAAVARAQATNAAPVTKATQPPPAKKAKTGGYGNFDAF